ncbi:Serine/threonine-protein phosphatase [Meloidogyne graminicola]|uniref:Serine/threonine-protein phosphatase n=1 Tax=Meloidogyne graminicola TaxID=189291 RepID=A0A8T0A177_9BILA|nr:Serine/threonine-protein phosphatase [Meloidogyne graminicola]
MAQPKMTLAEVDGLIERILLTSSQRFTQLVTAADIKALCNSAIDVLRSQPSLVEIDPPVVVCGDIHGQFSDLMRIFSRVGFPPLKNFLFLGDYVDRGRQSIETAVLLLAYKTRYPANFFLLRGNHECSNINRVYGFLEEIRRRFPHDTQSLWIAFNKAFAWLPFTALVGGRVLCMHGGISDRLRNLDQLRNLRRPVPDFDATNPTIELDLLWADPENGIQGCVKSPRGASVMFGEDVVARICKQLDIDLVVRAHQVVQDGAEFFANRKLITLFSAPHYAAQYNNAGATMFIDENLRCSFQVFQPAG